MIKDMMLPILDLLLFALILVDFLQGISYFLNSFYWTLL
jgi:hypothetical protein